MEGLYLGENPQGIPSGNDCVPTDSLETPEHLVGPVHWVEARCANVVRGACLAGWARGRGLRPQVSGV